MKKALLSVHFGFLFPFLLLDKGLDNTSARLMTLLFCTVASSGIVLSGRFAAFGDSQAGALLGFLAVALAVLALNSYLFSDEAFFQAQMLRLRAKHKVSKLFLCLVSYSLMLLAHYVALS